MAYRGLCLLSIALFLSGILVPSQSHAAIRVLHAFPGNGATYDGSSPRTALLLNESTFYGATNVGGADNRGTLYKINADGGEYALLHEFATGGGASPGSTLTIGSTVLYGATRQGGQHGQGTLFKIGIDGNGFETLHEFGAGEGALPDSLVLEGDTLFGAASRGGPKHGGTLFKINVDGSDFQLLHEFETDPESPDDLPNSLILSDSFLYGTTVYGGAAGGGTVFRLRTDGTGFEVLHDFAGGQDGGIPLTALTLHGSTLYGVTIITLSSINWTPMARTFRSCIDLLAPRVLTVAIQVHRSLTSVTSYMA